MIICKTPFRISFFGGGTDYPIWFEKYGGSVIGTTIDKYCYISCRWLPPFFDHKYRIVYSKMENTTSIDDINHPSVRECIRFSGLHEGIEVHHDSDLPARSGLGSSSSFTVGMLNCLNALKGTSITRKQLASDAIHVEQEKIGENVGSQDQIHAAYGGFNFIEFLPKGEFSIQPATINSKSLKVLQDHCLLFFTGISRFASEVAADQIHRTEKIKNELNEMKAMVPIALKLLGDRTLQIEEFGKLLHESWRIKTSLSDKISTDSIDKIYAQARKKGAIGGKLLGAGGGGFILFIAKPECHGDIREILGDILHVPIRFENSGSQIIFHEA